MKILRGHISAETAYVVDDYPYGFRLRCKKRYWLEYNPSHGSRLVTQTSKPKASTEAWNKPKASTYFPGPLAVMFLDDNGHVEWDALRHDSFAGDVIQFKDRFGGLLREDELKKLAFVERSSRRLFPEEWLNKTSEDPESIGSDDK